MPTHTLPEVQTETADDKPVWALQDRIEVGALAPGEMTAVSGRVGAVGALGDTDDRGTALAHGQHVRELLKCALGEDPQ
jgi:hypothetical protein